MRCCTVRAYRTASRRQRLLCSGIVRRHHNASSSPLDPTIWRTVIGVFAPYFRMPPSDLQSFLYPPSQGEWARILAKVVVGFIIFTP